MYLATFHHWVAELLSTELQHWSSTFYRNVNLLIIYLFNCFCKWRKWNYFWATTKWILVPVSPFTRKVFGSLLLCAVMIFSMSACIHLSVFTMKVLLDQGLIDWIGAIASDTSNNLLARVCVVCVCVLQVYRSVLISGRRRRHSGSTDTNKHNSSADTNQDPGMKTPVLNTLHQKAPL